jgi:ornithine cyclodeaminase
VPLDPLRVLSADDVHRALPWPALSAALEAAFATPPVAPDRHAHALSGDDSLLLMPAWSEAAIGVKLVTVIPTATDLGGRTVEATYLLLDRRTGAPQALLDGEALTVRRTAATSALAARALASPDARSLLVIGTGRLAPWMLRGYRAIMPSLTHFAVWGRNAESAARVSEELRAEGLAVEVARDRPSAVAAADIVSCVTTATEPVVLGAWLRDGVHLDLVGGFTPGMRESDDAAIARARVVVDTRSGAMTTAGDLLQPLAAGVIAESHVLAELGQVVRGEVRVRRDARDITLFKSVGHALEDFAAAQLALGA